MKSFHKSIQFLKQQKHKEKIQKAYQTKNRFKGKVCNNCGFLKVGCCCPETIQTINELKEVNQIMEQKIDHIAYYEERYKQSGSPTDKEIADTEANELNVYKKKYDFLCEKYNKKIT